jgi:hypothetical protein
MNGKNTMKRLQALPLLLGLLFASTAGMVSAQPAGDMGGASPTRAQVKMERDEFLKTHHYDEVSSNWVLNAGSEPPAGMKSRAEIKAERDEFLRNNRYDTRIADWVPMKSEPRDLNAMSREQVRSETKHFMRTHHWDDVSGSWMEQAPAKKKK